MRNDGLTAFPLLPLRLVLTAVCHGNLVLLIADCNLSQLAALLSAKTAKLDALDVDEGNCMSRLAALDMARRRFTMEPREGVSPTRRRTSVSTRARAASGAYGFSELARSFRTSGASSEGSDSSEVERIRASGEEDRVASVPEEHDGRPDGPSQRESLATSPASGAQAAGPRATQARGSGDSASVPRRAEKAKKPIRRRLSTTTSLTRPSEIPGNRAIRLERKTPGESLGFVLKTVKIATVDPDTGEPTGHFVDPTFVAEVGPEGLAYKSGMRAGDHILEIDGEACQTMKHEFVVRLLMQNQGTVSMVIILLPLPLPSICPYSAGGQNKTKQCDHGVGASHYFLIHCRDMCVLN
jgi:hypothetical protein